MILKRFHLRLGKKAMEKLLKPVAATWKGRLLEPPALNPGCSYVTGLTYSSGTFVSFLVLKPPGIFSRVKGQDRESA